MTVHYETKDRIAFITIDGIGPYNLFSPDEVYRPLVAAVERYRDDPEMWCALINAPSDKQAFTYGGHIGSVNELKNSTAAESRGYKFARNGASVFRPEDKTTGIRDWGHILHFDGLKVYKPVVMAIHAPCVGAGCLLASALADHIVAVPSVWFGLTELRWGIGGGGHGAQFRGQLPWRIMLDFVMRGRRMDADEALRYGFINQVVSPEQLMPAALEIAEDYVGLPPLAVQAEKRMAVVGRDIPWSTSRLMADLFGALIGDTTHDAKEGPKAFVEKRKPAYTGQLGNLGAGHQI